MYVQQTLLIYTSVIEGYYLRSYHLSHDIDWIHLLWYDYKNAVLNINFSINKKKFLKVEIFIKSKNCVFDK